MYESRNRADLIIEVWEKLDCESVGAKELIAIEDAVRASFGESAVDSPMVLARYLADEGAELRHSEIMELYVERSKETEYDAALRNIAAIDDLNTAAASIRRMENLRRKYSEGGDKEGLRLLRERALTAKELANKYSLKQEANESERLMHAEIAEWITIWLRTPEMFEQWLRLRKRSAEYRAWFGE
jgi:hypothetical protein